MMSRIAHVVRIQGRYVYRRRVHFRNIISKPLSFALRTACPKMARRTSARLSARFEEVKDKIATMLASHTSSAVRETFSDRFSGLTQDAIGQD